ncbi:uncharacterized protein LOC135819517 [Sycon ciliatum]|uniref:uncharacterized protein LOC135819517 n=1 Tax=Sycon ciliatum TaxID=27933 RepID=UPI0031F66C79
MAVRRFLPGPFLGLASLLVLTSAGMVQSIPRLFTVINSATCRYRYQLPTDKVGTCDYPRCWVAPNLLLTENVTVPFASEEICIVRAPRDSSYIELFFELPDTSFSSPDCNKNTVYNRVLVQKVLGNGTQLKTVQNGAFHYEIAVGSASDPWCRSKNLVPVQVPSSDRCGVTVKIEYLHFNSYYEGNWQFVVQPLTGTGLPPTMRQFDIQFTGKPCDTCFAPDSSCESLSYSHVFSGTGFTVVPAPVYKIPIGSSRCFRFEDTRDTNGGWFIARGATLVVAEPLQYSELGDASDAEATHVTVHNLARTSVYGNYQQCVHIDNMTASLAGLLLYKFSNDYAAVNMKTGTIAIRIEAEVLSKFKQEEETGTIKGIHAWCAVLTTIVLVLCVVVGVMLRKLKQVGYNAM